MTVAHDKGRNGTDVKLARLEIRMESVEKACDEFTELRSVIADLRVSMSQFQTQIKVNWLLMTMIIGGLIGVAFSVWKGP